MVALMDQDLNSVDEQGKNGIATSALPKSCHLIELDLLGNVLWSWSYPTCDNELKLVCLRKFNAIRRGCSKQEEAFKFFRYHEKWFYVFISCPITSYGNKPPKLVKLDQVSVIVEALDFNPERYQIITEVLFHTYLKQEDPTVVLQQFLSLLVSGTCQLPKKKIFHSSDYDTHTPFTDFQFKSIISTFGLETIVLLTAVARKQRIVIYHHDIDGLIKYALSIPAIGMDNRTTWDHVYPWVGCNEDELSYFTDSKVHIIGCPNANIENRSDLYDVFINIPAGEITVSSHAKDKMMMSKPHKEMALFMVQLAENEEINEAEIVTEIRAKAKELSIDTHQLKKQTSDVDEM